FNNQEYTERYNQKLNNNIDKIAIGNGYLGGTRRLISFRHDILHITKVDSTSNIADGWHNNIIYHRRHNLAKGTSNYHTDSKIDNTPPHGKFFKFFQKPHNFKFKNNQ